MNKNVLNAENVTVYVNSLLYKNLDREGKTMENMINLTIDNKKITVPAGTTILNAAKQNGIYIPTLCNDDIVKVYGACGICVVEGEGMPKLMRD